MIPLFILYTSVLLYIIYTRFAKHAECTVLSLLHVLLLRIFNHHYCTTKCATLNCANDLNFLFELQRKNFPTFNFFDLLFFTITSHCEVWWCNKFVNSVKFSEGNEKMLTFNEAQTSFSYSDEFFFNFKRKNHDISICIYLMRSSVN